MPAVRPMPPAAIRGLLESKGYRVIREDKYNWAFSIAADDVPVIVPHNVDLVPLEVASHVMRTVGFDAYSEALEQNPPWPADPSDTTH